MTHLMYIYILYIVCIYIYTYEQSKKRNQKVGHLEITLLGKKNLARTQSGLPEQIGTNKWKKMEKQSERCFKWVAKLQFRKVQQHFFNFASLSQPKIAVQIWGPNLRPIDVQSMAANTLKLWSCRKGFGKTACSTVIYHVKPLFLGLLFNSC